MGLRESHRCCPKGVQDREIKTGGVVLVHEDTSRSNWRLGEVIEVIESSDGYERGALLQVTNKKGKHSRIRRPTQKPFLSSLVLPEVFFKLLTYLMLKMLV